ncbi:DMT family protein [Xanthomonas dyei]|uniref:DMT family protein n=1 Tax=Xanthomonas dyei TaxID=743699 RepID=UPI003D17C6A7
MPVGAHPGATGITRKAASRPGALLRKLGPSPVLQEVITLLVFAGFSTFYLGQSLKWNHWAAVLQEVITLLVFAGFSTFYLGQSLKWNHWAAFGLILVAAFLMFKE